MNYFIRKSLNINIPKNEAGGMPPLIKEKEVIKKHFLSIRNLEYPKTSDF